jgi:hypothetical protein
LSFTTTTFFIGALFFGMGTNFRDLL